MEAFKKLTARVVPLDRANVDTDAIIPKQFLKSIRRTGFGPHLFDGWRYLDVGELGMDCARRALNPDFVLNRPEYQGAQILLTRKNFGCGSSREHAPWALMDYGFRVILAPSFADIFAINSFKNGLLLIELDDDLVDRFFQEVAPGYEMTIDLENSRMTIPGGERFPFHIDESRRQRLLQGLDEIALSLQHAAAIRAYEARRAREAPWLFSAAE